MGSTYSVTATAVSSMNKKQDSILWEVKNVKEAAKLSELKQKPMASFSFGVGEFHKKLQCTLEHDPRSTQNLLLNMDFVIVTSNKKETQDYRKEGGSVFFISVCALHSRRQWWHSIFKKNFLSDCEWKEQIGIENFSDYESSNGSLKLCFQVTEYLEKDNEFCTTKILTEEKKFDILRFTTTNNLTRDDITRDFASLLGDKTTADLKITVFSAVDDEKDVRVFCAHKAILSARNEVFRRMFENNEMKEVKEGHVEISDISIKAMEWFLRYLYTGVVMSESEDTEEEQRFFGLLPEIAYIADKYNDGHLKNVCETNLHRSVTPENIRELLNCARLHGLTAAEAELRKIIARDPYNPYLDALLS